MVLNRWLLLMLLALLHEVTGTMVKLNNGGFEDIVIAINPGLPEDNKIIDNIKVMVKEASNYLFSATKKRFYYKTVKVIIPLTWTPKPEYNRITIESYDKADVIVAEPFLKYGDDPYTLQYGGCGIHGRYIHFTSNFLTNNLDAIYGSRGKVFVHEWAHLRWGVFDEYNSDAPFYTSGINQAEATRCSAGVTGQYKFRTSAGTLRNCKFDHRTQVYEAGCQFYPDKKQSTPASIMYMQSLSSVIAQKYSTTEGCEIVLLTDGEDSTVASCFSEVKSSGSIIHTIALGPSAEKELNMLADMTGGLKFFATDSLDTNGLIDAFSGISSGSGNISQQSIQLESKGETIKPSQWLDGTVTIDKTVGNDTFFVVTWSVSTYPPGIFLRDPKGKKYSQTDFTIDPTNRKTARLQINGTAEVGDWTYTIQNTHSAAQVLSVTVTTRAANASLPPVTVKPYMNADTNNYPNPIIIYAEVSQEFSPILGANVTATVESVSGKTTELQLFDNGSGADILKHDGIYSKYFTAFKENGRYNIKVRVQGRDKTVRRGRRQNRSIYVPGYVEDGEIIMNPPRPEPSEDDIEANLGKFSRTASGGSFVMANVPPGNPPDIFPPCKITDLEVELKDDDEFLLSWTAPGGDYDEGKAERYEIKMSENLEELRNNFHSALSVNTSGLTTEVAGVKQSFQFKPENIREDNGTTIFFAIRAIDNSSNAGETSNIVKTVRLLAPLPSTPPTHTSSNNTTPTSSSTNASTDENNSPVLNTVTIIIIIVCVAVIIICAIISITICVVNKRKIVRPETGL
ncbi:calcium-activated chloride channel regulator 1-like isoform X3 [Elgaria multicarinata webbii]|uniref:calcium-activated chloride channel regulator 1-like isoform X3 n=1 Tax=Elgaria multicarinata webbii TaxID=159646 RepID=UPI002FCD038D